MSTSVQPASLIRGQDWRVPKNTPYPSRESLNTLQCPFELGPNDVTNVPTEHMRNVVQGYLGEPLDETIKAPWTGYYTKYEGTWRAVANAYRMWFELRRRDGTFEAVRVARLGMGLNHLPMDGIDIAGLTLSGEEIPTPARRPTPINEPTDEPIEEERPQLSSQTTCGRPPPRGTGDDPFGLANLAGGLMDDKPVRLEGIPLDKFEGNRAKTHQFLTQFKRFMMMNRRSAIARDPLSKAAYFLSLVGGSKADGWAERQYAWLDEVERDPHILPYRMTAWDALEQDFKTSFIDYAVHEKAHEQLRNLKMKDGNIDQFIADFEFLAHRAQVDTDDPTVLHLFKMGIPVRLMDACVDHGPPTSFEQWTKAAQQQQRNWIIKQGVRAQHAAASSNVMQSQSQNNAGPHGQFFWRPRNSNQTSQQGGTRPPRARLPPQDPNAMDTSAGAARKAMTKEEKRQYREKGRCFECGKQGHLARNCPDKKTRVRTTNIETVLDTTSDNRRSNFS